ncbi:MAG TPA: DUF4304 domain-containing protein [Archangium sp.]|uniref:DUF4304 domain-containing protein n=1 Tax=Archangium sp. TaxID=1872627 RepID=UPI002E36B28C|nr:DUF4304 domain-containing protein [Archangium sp.]HEX5751171.1 DUF4304 domain-containing protein [Archangium sp.]
MHYPAPGERLTSRFLLFTAALLLFSGSSLVPGALEDERLFTTEAPQSCHVVHGGAMKDSTSLNRTVMARELRKADYKGRANTWHKPCQDTILVVNLQKSQYGDVHYINLGVWVRLLGENEAPKEYQCHIRQRATSLRTEKAKALEQALNFVDTAMSPEEREALIAEFMRTEAIPFLESIATMEGIRTAVETQQLRGGMVPERLRDLLVSKP